VPSYRTCAAAVLAVLAAGGGVIGAQGRGRSQGASGPPPTVFRTDVPAHDLDVLLARPTDTSVTLSVLSANDATAAFDYEPGGSPRSLALKAGVPLDLDLRGLAPNLAYRYTITRAGAATATGSFRTARPSGTTFAFAVQADSHLDGNTSGRMYENTLANIASDQPDFLVDLGDTFMTEKYQDYREAARQYVAQRYYFGLVGRTVPVLLALGNHDGEAGWRTRNGDVTAWAASIRRKYFPPVASSGFYSVCPGAGTCYAWHWGDALFIVLDPFSATRNKPRTDEDGWEWTLGRAQYDWLRATLQASRARLRFVFIHHLVGGAGRDARGGAEAAAFFEWGGANANESPGFTAHRPGWPMPIHDLLVANHVSAVFHGHDHLYVHQDRDGIAYQEVPQPGHERGDATGSAREYGYRSGTLLGSSGHIRVRVSAEGATVEYVKSRLTGRNADVVDRYTIRPLEVR
jgi:hypothetical protein